MKITWPWEREETELGTSTEYDRMIKFVETAWRSRAFIVPCLVGPPGIGKTAAVRQAQQRLNPDNKLVVINAQRCIPSEVTSMTMPDTETRRMVLYNSEQLESLEDGDWLFFDELLEAHPNVLAVLLTLIESRIKPDGRPLPDIMIVSATNATVSPGQLPLNIRQRFMFCEFKVDAQQVQNYVKDRFDILLPSPILRKLTDRGDVYNVLTPRSLTKIVQWIDEADDRATVADVIDSIWSSNIGHTINNLIRQRDQKIFSPDVQVRNALKRLVSEHVYDANDFEHADMEDIFKVLQSLSDWDEIRDELAKLELEEIEEEEEKTISF